MRSAFVSAVLWLGLVASVHPAAVSTQDTIVVARSDDDQSTVVSSTAAEVTTDEPLTPIKLTEMDVRSEVSLRYARTAVVTHVRNAAKKSQEATFRVLLPDSAFISGFVMTLGGKSYKAYVKEKEEAKQIYNDAVSMGLGAAHVSAKARDSNHFTVSVNVEANTTAVFNLTYEELLVRRNGVYNHAINLHPGALVPKMKVVVHIRESQKITQLRVPELRTGNEVDATDEDAQNSKAVIERGNKDREATITFSPDLQEQERLIEIYAAKTKESASHHNSWSNEDNDEKKKEDVLGQFVVQYDVERPKNGEILVNDGYFVHFLAPTSLPPLKKHVVFVLDTSGSMMGRKVEQLRDAMKTILSKLNPGDYFNIVEFNSGVQVHDLKEASEPEPKPTYSYYENSYETSKLLAPEQATPENIEKAKVIVSRLQASGGTNIYSALDVAINLIHKGTGGSSNNSVPTVNEELPRAEASTDAKSPQDNNTAVSKENEDKKDNLEPIIIFLTDGDPTVGETDTGRIISHLTEKNYGERKASIFSLAFGEDADRSFLRKLSLRNEGFMRHIYEAADAALQLRDFYRQVSSPLLSEVKFIYPPEQIKEGSLTRHKFRTVYDGSEAVVAGQIVDNAPEVTPRVLGFCGVDDGVGRKRYEITPKVPVSRVKSEYLPLERLWAYLTVKQLLDERDASDSDQKAENSPEKKALKIALKYEFVTPLTSLVVVKPNETNAVDAESVDKKGGSYSNFAPLSAQYASHAIGAPSAFGFVPPGAGYLSQSLSAAPVSTLDLDSTNLFQESEDLHDRASMSVDSGLQQIYGDLDDRAAFFPRSFIRRPSSPIHMPLFRSGYHHNSVQPRSGYDYYDSIFPGFPDVRFEAEDVDSHYDISTSYVPTTYAPTPALPPSPLAPYHLERCTWAEQALNTTADELVIDVNGTQVNLKLTKENDAPKAADGDGDAACPAATDGAAGLCVYLTRCDAAANVTAATYSGLYCTVNDKYAGICCPASEVDKKTN